VKRLAAALLITLSALAGAAWWAGGSEGAVRDLAGGPALPPASSPRRPPIDLVLEYDPPPSPAPARSAPSASAARRLSPPRPDPPSAAVAEYLPPGDSGTPSPALASELPRAHHPVRVAVSAAPPATPAIAEADLPPDLTPELPPDLPPDRAALLRRLLAIRERVGASD